MLDRCIRVRSAEIVETLIRRGIDFCCIQEHRWRGASVRKIVGKGSIYKFFWVGNYDGFGGVGVILAEKWIEKIIDVKRVNSRIIVINILVGQAVLAVVSTYAPQQVFEDSVKNKFYDELLATNSKFNARELVIIAGDLNGHVGKASDGYEGIHGGSETLWWNDKVSVAITEKRRLWKVWRSGGSKEDYIDANRKARSEVYAARKLADEKRFSNILRRDDKKQALFKIAKKMSQSNVDFVGEKCVRNDSGTLAFTDTAKKEAWRSHYNRLLNEDFAWDKEHITIADAISGPAVKIERETVIKAIGKMKGGKATGPTGIAIDMLKASGDVSIDLVSIYIDLVLTL